MTTMTQDAVSCDAVTRSSFGPRATRTTLHNSNSLGGSAFFTELVN